MEWQATKNHRERFLTSRSDGPEGVAAMDGRPQKSPHGVCHAGFFALRQPLK
jgi:hypothetical protein